MTSVLDCKQLTKYYQQGSNKVEVLSDLDFSLLEAERLAIIGSSGSGKSTLLNMLGGLDQPSAGVVELLGAPFSTLSTDQRAQKRNQHLGFVYQFHHLLGEFSAVENAAMAAMIAGQSRKAATQLASHWLEQLGLAHRLNHRPAELSGGERQRVAIARALINEPECVLMDEPTGNLDRATANSLMHLLHELSANSKTSFVIVTHDEQIAFAMDRVLRLQEGKLEPMLPMGAQ